MRQRLEEGGNMDAHVNKMTELFQKLLAMCEEIKPEFFMCATLLGSVPESYDALIQALEARSEEDLTSNLVSSKLIAEYKRRNERNQDEKDAIALKIESSKAMDDTGCFFCKLPGQLPSNGQMSRRMRICINFCSFRRALMDGLLVPAQHAISLKISMIFLNLIQVIARKFSSPTAIKWKQLARELSVRN